MTLSSRFRFVSWGVFPAMFDIRIGAVDILPDVVGYVLLVIGCGGLEKLSGRFAVARIVWAILAVLSVVPTWFLGARATDFISLVKALQGVGLWFLLGGMIEFARAAQRWDLARSLGRSRIFFVGFLVLIAAYKRSSANHDPGVVVVMVAGTLLTLFMVLRGTGRVRRELAENVTGEFRCSSTPAVLTVLVTVGLGIFFVSQHSGYRSTTFSGANFHGKSPQDCAVVDADFQNLLRSKGFSGNYQPGEMDQFAGLHSADSKDIWLKSDRDEFKGIYLKIMKSPLTIFMDTKWEHDGFKSGEVRTQRKAYGLALEVARWFQQRPEKQKLSPGIEEAGIRYFEESLANLPAE